MTEAIKNGLVSVNGVTVENFKHPVDVDSDSVTVNNKIISVRANLLTTLILNKPRGITSTTSDDRQSITVLDIIPKKYHALRLYPVGRLDRDSTGLILLTNDGEMTNRLTHPRYGEEKEYLVQTDGNLKPDEKKQFEKGLKLEDGFTREAVIRDVKTPPYNYSVTIREGKKRQIRRMFAALGYRVVDLKRIRIGRLKLGTLPEGKVRELTPNELKALKRT